MVIDRDLHFRKNGDRPGPSRLWTVYGIQLSASGPPMLTTEEIARYSRHLLLPEVGVEGQERLKASSVLVVGAGGLGSPLLMYLAAAGIGTIGIVDFDVVDVTNLQRQILFGHADVGRKKLAAAETRLAAINPHVRIVRHDTRLVAANALDLIGQYDIVADGTDNFATRYLVNDACVIAGRPNVYASIYRFDGQVSVFGVKDAPCYRCVYPEPPPPGTVPSCSEGGVLGVLPGIIGSIQASEVIKLAGGFGEPLVGRLLLFDALDMRFRTLKIPRDPTCPLCGDKPTQTKLIDYDAFCGPAVPEISTHELKTKLDTGDDFLLLDVRSEKEFDMTNIGGTLIPLPELMGRLSEISECREKDIVVICRSGARSGTAVKEMKKHGFKRVFNLRGGLLAWSETIDSTVPR